MSRGDDFQLKIIGTYSHDNPVNAIIKCTITCKAGRKEICIKQYVNT